jgi:tRNA A-37 threonylcarbamoyl transferase component Bud32
MKLIKELKSGLGSTKIELVNYNGEMIVLKHFKTKNKLIMEESLYELLKEEDFVPKVRFVDYEKNILGTTYCGDSLNMRYPMKERYVFKNKIREIAKLLEEKYNIYHNDLRWKNICVDDGGNIRFIDWERWGNENKERDPEFILKDKESKYKDSKTLFDIIDTEGEPNILENMVDTNFKGYKIVLLKKDADPDAIVLEGFDDALIGVSHDGRLIYDLGVMRKILQDRDKMCPIEADEFLDFNVLSTKFGELNPIYVTLYMDLVFQTLK